MSLSLASRVPVVLFCMALLGTGCPPKVQPDDTGPVGVDTDGDGYTSDIDCNDGDPTVHPDADEPCDGIDNDCDGEVDEEGSTLWYADADGDGYGDHDTSQTACGQPSGFVGDDSDCDDADGDIHPGADEPCDGVDNDCDGQVDEDGQSPWYLDADGDGYGDPGTSVTACGQPSGYVADSRDCDDGDAGVNPAGTEVCNGIDDDCDGDTDDADTSVTGQSTWYADADGDGYGDASSTVSACGAPTGYVEDATDCDDSEPRANPGADELCDGIDDDCDGLIDEADAIDQTTWYPDVDNDGYGDPAGATLTQCNQPTGYVTDATDCNDLESTAYPGATEVCDDIDNDCDGSIDEYGAVGAPTWYADGDGDGYGNAARTVTLCDAPSGYVADATDCDDASASVHPGATETCNGTDDDCDGATDDADTSVTGQSTWYADADSDGYGALASSRRACTQPTGYVADSTDCDDTAARVNPGATEICNRIDDDCDGLTDDADTSVTGRTTWYMDRDSDAYGDASLSSIACFQPSGYVANRTDCDDREPLANPGQAEVCDGIDNDCDGTVDESDATDADTWYADADADGYGNASRSSRSCTQPSGYILDGTDCDDRAATVNPGATETCNGTDDDCNGLVDDNPIDGLLLATDDDGDGFGALGTMINQCDGVENDLDCIDTDPTEPQVVDASTTSTTHDGSLDHPWLAIQDGIDTALSCVVVYPGLYTENLDFSGKDVSVTSTDGAEATILDGSTGSGPVVTFNTGETSDALLSGFTLTGGSGYEEENTSSYSCGSGDTCTDHYISYCGGGVYVEGAAPTLLNLVIQGNVLTAPADYISGSDAYYYFTYGGGMCFRSTSMSVSQVDLYENGAEDGGAVYLEGTTTVVFQHALVMANTASFGAAFEVDGGTLTLMNVITAWNEATDTAGGVFASDATLAMTNTVSAEDDAPTAGGLYLTGTTVGTVMNTAVWGSDTGACVTVDSSATFAGSYNDVYGCAGGTYSGVTSPTGTLGNISLYPWFTSVTANGDYTDDDWHLCTTSPLVNTGDPATGYNDADGTRNDIGAYGGPLSDWD